MTHSVGVFYADYRRTKELFIARFGYCDVPRFTHLVVFNVYSCAYFFVNDVMSDVSFDANPALLPLHLAWKRQRNIENCRAIRVDDKAT